MAYSANILADSVCPRGRRLTTMEVTFPRIVLSEFNTHRVFSRNSASSRAIPVEKRISALTSDPFIPEAFGKNCKGMQSSDTLVDDAALQAESLWREALGHAITTATQLSKLQVHKQWANRLLEPFGWQTVIVSSTTWSNFFALRDDDAAQPEIRKIAVLMREALNASTPQLKHPGEWHLPLILNDELGLDIELLKRVSSARCARVSYMTHDGKRDIAADEALYHRLLSSGHMSPFEHVATPEDPDSDSPPSNFEGWIQHRKFLTNESDYSLIKHATTSNV